MKPGTGKWTNEGKRMRALTMYNKGKEFAAAGILLNEAAGSKSFVQMHLILQGYEIILKGILLYFDFDKHNRNLKSLGHNLVKLTNKVKQIKDFEKSFDNKFLKDLSVLNQQYINTNLRYGSLLDIFIDPTTFEIDFIIKKTEQLIRGFDEKINAA